MFSFKFHDRLTSLLTNLSNTDRVMNQTATRRRKTDAKLIWKRTGGSKKGASALKHSRNDFDSKYQLRAFEKDECKAMLKCLSVKLSGSRAGKLCFIRVG